MERFVYVLVFVLNPNDNCAETNHMLEDCDLQFNSNKSGETIAICVCICICFSFCISFSLSFSLVFVFHLKQITCWWIVICNLTATNQARRSLFVFVFVFVLVFVLVLVWVFHWFLYFIWNKSHVGGLWFAI